MLAEIRAWEKAADDTVTQAIPLLAELGTTDESDHTLAQGAVNRNADRQPLENELATTEEENSLAQTEWGWWNDFVKKVAEMNKNYHEEQFNNM